ncbi:hypothetical protein [Persephonella sp.]
MRKDIYKTITQSITDKLGEVGLKEEKFLSEYTVIEKAYTHIDRKKIKLFPVSFGFEGEFIEGKVVKIDSISPLTAFEKFENHILYIPQITKLNQFYYIKRAKPKAVLTNTEIRKKLFFTEFPVFYLPSFVTGENIHIKIKTKKYKKEFKNLKFDTGIGAYIIYLHFPFDSRFSDPNSLTFYSSLNCTISLMEKLSNVKYPRGFRIRFLFSDCSYSDYEGLSVHLKNYGDVENTVSIFHIENCGAGNEKLIVKTDRNIIDRFHLNKINRLLDRLNLPLKIDRLKDYSQIGNINLPVVWFNSQPNRYIYHLKKEFLNEKLISEQVNLLFYIINNIYKEVE